VKQQRSPLKWWQIKLLVPLMFGLLVLDKKYLALSPLGHQFMLVAIVIVVYGLMAYWLYVNQAAVREASDQAEPWRRIDDLEPARPSTSSSVESGQNKPIAAERSDHMVVPSPAQPASIYMQTKRGASIRTWLN
jgi:hypothetical protein